MTMPDQPTQAPQTTVDYQSIYNEFFAPLTSSQADILPFPGFGFWTRDYAKWLANVTAESTSIGS